MLPIFKYHPDPIKTGAIEVSNEVCESCGKARGYIYTSSVYATENIEYICPWCIADGSVHRKLDGELVDTYPLLEAGLSPEIIEEVSQRTPGYVSWQQETWLACCNDACEFHGDVSQPEIQKLDADDLQNLSHDSGFSVSNLQVMIKQYQPKGNPAFYKFVCRHCKRVRYHVDCD